MKVLQVAPGFRGLPELGWGGTEVTIQSTASVMSRRSYDIMVMNVAGDPQSRPTFRILEVRPHWRWDGNLLFHAARGLSYGRAVSAHLRGLLMSRRVDVVHFHSQWSAAPGIPLVLRHGLPAVFGVHNWAWSDEGYCRSPIVRAMHALELWSMRRATEVICDTKHVAANLIRYHGVRGDRLTAIPNGADEAFFVLSPVDEQVRHRFAPQGGPVVLCVARIIPYKNQLTLVRAILKVATTHPTVRFLFVGPVGSAAYMVKLRQALAADNVQERAVFVGEVDRALLLQLYALADVFVLCSTAESQGMSMMDAMAAGKAIVASRIGSLVEMLEDGSQPAGLFVDPTEPLGLGAAISRLLDDAMLRTRLARAAQYLAKQKYTWDRHVDSLLAVYDRAISTTRRHRNA